MTRARSSQRPQRASRGSNSGGPPNATYRIVSEITHHGEQLAIPDDAVRVTVQPLGHPGVARVTYLTPLRDVRFNDERGRDVQQNQRYIY